MQYHPLDDKDRELIAAASQAIERNFCDPRHTVGAAVWCPPGRIHTGVNVDSCGYGPCAEPVAIGRAITEGERVFEAIVAVAGPGDPHPILPPCGNCRQMIYDYAPDCWVILSRNGEMVKARARDLLPDAYSHFD
jgi:cytidine deaminase